MCKQNSNVNIFFCRSSVINRQRRWPLSSKLLKISADRLLPKKQSRPSETRNITNLKLSMDSTGNKKILNNKPSTSNVRDFPSLKKFSKCRTRVLGFGVDDSSSSSGDTEPVPRRRKKTSRALSDYESDDNDVGKANSSSASSSRVNATEGVTEKTITENVCCTNTIKFKDSSSSGSDELFVKLASRRGSVRALSDYDSGDSIYHAGKALLNLSKGNQNVNNSTNSFQQNHDLDSSSENSTMYNEFKRPRNIFSTSDSSDSESSVRQRCFRKRIRINISSEESDDENTNIAHSHRSCRPNQNDLTRTNGGIDNLDTRPQTTRNLKQKMNNQWMCGSSESDSSSVEIVRRVMRDEIVDVSATVNTNSNSSQQNLMEGLSSDGQLNRHVHSATNERSTESTQQNSTVQQIIRRTRQLSNRNRQLLRRTRILRQRNNELEAQRLSSQDTESESNNRNRQLIRRTRQLRRGNNGLEAQRMSSWFTESELSSDNMCVINSVIRLNTGPLVDSSDSDSDLQFEPRRLRGGTIQLNYSDSDSNIEQIPLDAVITSGTADADGSPNSLVRCTMQDENSSDSDANSEKCPICFCSFGKKEVASPVSCDHSFCTKCIEEWAKSKNTCPIDRKHFDKLVIRPNFLNEKCIRVISIETPVETRFWEVENDHFDGDLIEWGLSDNLSIISSSEEEEEEICCVCYSSSYPQNLILCDMCNSVYHLSCLTPPLRYIPARNWFCPRCPDGVD